MKCGLRPSRPSRGISDCGIKTPNFELPRFHRGRRTPNYPSPFPLPSGERVGVRGMSLIEVILVTLVIAILAAVIIPRVGFDTAPRASVEGAAHMVASDIRYTQECAMSTRTSKTITFSAGGNSYSFAPSNNLDPSGRLPAGVTTSALTLTFNSLGEPIAGGGGSLTVSGSGGSKTISISNYTGKVSIL